MTKKKLILSDLPENKKNEILEKLRNMYGDALIDDILNNNEPLTEHYYNNILLR
jgi:hypothetical protein